ncbi:hypothetical protein BpHYR1_049524 [Brachionus plicatilis]|uniref:Uncharacterized protein n=1 Tax=Brachionus plicatilis TaxID=10195 RepID=A0A3M7RF11_BRAPC|nr:hypothetical protein BpHYR1_049524 [Brachionus plicatilis]
MLNLVEVNFLANQGNSNNKVNSKIQGKMLLYKVQNELNYASFQKIYILLVIQSFIELKRTSQLHVIWWLVNFSFQYEKAVSIELNKFNFCKTCYAVIKKTRGFYCPNGQNKINNKFAIN